MTTHMYSRRHFSRDLLGTLLVGTLVQAVAKAEAFEGSVRQSAGRWLQDLQAASSDLRARSIEPKDWQQRVENCLQQADLTDVLRAINYQRLSERVRFAEHHESVDPVHFSRRMVAPGDLSFSPWFFAMKKDVSVVPHGHHNMVTMHMILKGRAHGRHFDRVHDEPGYLTITPTSDKVLGPGEVTTISDQRNNIHWFTALSEPVFMFNIQVVGLDPTAPVGGRDYIDPAHGEELAGGLIRARRLDEDEAYKLYGHV